MICEIVQYKSDKSQNTNTRWFKKLRTPYTKTLYSCIIFTLYYIGFILDSEWSGGSIGYLILMIQRRIMMDFLLFRFCEYTDVTY